MAEIPKLNELKGADRVLTSIGNKLESIASATGKWSDEIIKAGSEARDLATKLASLKQIDIASRSDEQKKKIESLTEAISDLGKKAGTVGQVVKDKLWSGFDQVAKKVMALQVSLGGLALDGLISSIQKVYDLQERWAKVTGEMNMKMGALSPNMAEFKKSASAAEGAVRGLTDVMGEGTKIAGDFTLAYGKMDTGKTGKFIVGLARGFDLGGEAAGKLSRTLSDMSDQVGAKAEHEQAEFFKTITMQAGKAGISVTALAKDIADNSKTLVSFGNIGKEAFVKSAAYLKKFNMSLKETDAFMTKFDTFDDAAKSVAELNTAFGTSINALNVMLENDPAKRFEMIRKGMLASGKDLNNMNRQEIAQLKQSTGLDEDAIKAMLDKKNAGMSYEKFLAQKEDKEKKRLSAEKQMQIMTKKTATTMFAMSQAMDKITVAIGKAIKPFLQLLGLAKDDNWHSFSSTMQGITDAVVKFFEKLAKNKQWVGFMQKAADLVKRAAVSIGEFFGKDLDKNIETIIKWFKRFEIASAAILALWSVGKIGGMVSGITKLWGAFKNLSMAQEVAGAAGKGGGILSKVASGAGGLLSRAGRGIAGPIAEAAQKSPIVSGLSRAASWAGGGLKQAGGAAMGGLRGAAGWLGEKAMSIPGVSKAGGMLASAGGKVAGMAGRAAGAVGGLGGVAGIAGAAMAGYALGTFLDQKYGISDYIAGIHKFQFAEDKKTKEGREAVSKAENELKMAMEQRSKTEGDIAKKTDLLESRAAERDKKDSFVKETISDLDESFAKTKQKTMQLSEIEQKQLDERVDSMLSAKTIDQKHAALLKKQLKSTELSVEAFKDLKKASAEYERTIETLNKQSEKQINREKRGEDLKYDLEKNKLEREKKRLSDDEKSAQVALDRAKGTKLTIETERDVNDALKELGFSATTAAEEKKKGIDKEELAQQVQNKRANAASQKLSDLERQKIEVQKKMEALEEQHSKAIFKIRLRSEIMMSKEFQEFRAGLPKGTELDDAFGKFVDAGKGMSALEGMGLSKTDIQNLKNPSKKKAAAAAEQHAAGGGLFRQPTHVLIGESGPELVVPLSRGLDLGGGASGAPVNYAGGRSKSSRGGGETKIVAGDVYLDSKLVGRHLVSNILNDGRE